jgi:acetoin utilization deacetylase AcuC-like enzyme
MIALQQALQRSGLLPELRQLSPRPATNEQLRRVHTRELIDYVRVVSERGGGLLDQGDTCATAESYEQARLAVGGCCAAVDEIMSGAAANGLALVRPPGHHAEIDRVSGFCLFNNVAAAARHAQAVHGARKVAIVDFDVHHGNGTQDIFYEDNSVLFISVHLFAPYFYPGIGGMYEVGIGAGNGYTLNVPLPPYVGDQGYNRVFDELISPRLARFAPDLLLVSAGFDAHWEDPLAMAGLSLTGYASITRKLIADARRLCDGRILFVLEGGYHLDVLSAGVINVLHALLGQDIVHDRLGPMPQPESDISQLLERLKAHYLSK